MNKKIKFSLIGFLVLFCLCFAFSYCSMWGYRAFENRIVEYIYGGVLVIILMFVLIKYKKKLNVVGLLMFGGIVVLLFWGASISYVLFYLALFAVILIGMDSDEVFLVSKVINFFVWIQLCGMLICWLLPEFYVQYVLSAFEGLDYFDRLGGLILAGRTNIGFTTQNAHFAGFIVMGVGNRIILYKDKLPYAKQRDAFFVLLSTVGLYLSGKRAHFLFCIAALLVAYYLKGYLDKRRQSAFLRFMGVVAVAFLGFLVLWGISQMVEGTFLNEIFYTLKNLRNSNVDITTGRTEFWIVALNLFKSNPLKGIGWKKFYDLQFYGEHYDVHNIYLQLLCEVGIIGAAVFFALFVFALYRAIKVVKQRTIDVKYKQVALFSLFYQVFFLLYGITGNPLYDASYYIMYYICVAFVVSIPTATSCQTEDRHENSNYNVS